MRTSRKAALLCSDWVYFQWHGYLFKVIYTLVVLKLHNRLSTSYLDTQDLHTVYLSHLMYLCIDMLSLICFRTYLYTIVERDYTTKRKCVRSGLNEYKAKNSAFDYSSIFKGFIKHLARSNKHGLV